MSQPPRFADGRIDVEMAARAYTVTVIAYDAAGNVGTQMVSVTLK